MSAMDKVAKRSEELTVATMYDHGSTVSGRVVRTITKRMDGIPDSLLDEWEKDMRHSTAKVAPTTGRAVLSVSQYYLQG